MTRRFWVLAGALLASAACSSAQQNQFPGDDTDPTSGDDGGGGGSSSGGGSGSSSGTSSGGRPAGYDAGIDQYVAPIMFSDAAAKKFYDTSVPDAEQAQSATLTITPFTVPAGDELYMCQWFANPFGGQDADIVEIDGQMSEGSHHFFVFNMSTGTGQTTASPEVPCPSAGLEFFPYIYLSQQPNWDVTYPQANMGYPLAGTNGLMMNVHYLNAGTTDIEATATVTIHTAKPGVVTTHVGNLFLNNNAMSVPANTPMNLPSVQTSSNTPNVGGNYNILQSWSHMHQYALKFQAALGAAAPFYTEPQWDEPPVVNYWPNPIAVQAGTPITWSCDYYNPTNTTMTFGDSAKTDVMCIYFGQYYPAIPVSQGGPDVVNVVTGF